MGERGEGAREGKEGRARGMRIEGWWNGGARMRGVRVSLKTVREINV